MDSQNQTTNSSNPVVAAEPQRAHNNALLLGICAYLGVLVIVPLFLAGKKNAFVTFHAKQGAVLFAIEILVWLLGSMLWQVWMILRLVNLAVFILSIIGIVNVVQHKQKELPLVGHLSKFVKF